MRAPGAMNRLDPGDIPRDSDEALDRLHRSGWSIGDAAFAVEGGGLAWVVSGRRAVGPVRSPSGRWSSRPGDDSRAAPGLNPEGFEEVPVNPPTDLRAVLADESFLQRAKDQRGLRLAAHLQGRDLASDLSELAVHEDIGPAVVAAFDTETGSGETASNHIRRADFHGHGKSLICMGVIPLLGD
jgi:hypothetical protein